MAEFNDMPAEIRNMIYEPLLSQSHSQNTVERLRSNNAFSLFTVSKQIHDETTSYFYQNNNIKIYTPSQTTETATILPPIADRYLRFLGRVRVLATIATAESTTHTKVAGTIASLANIGAKFEDVHIFINSSLSRLVNKMVDDSILDADHPIIVALQKLLGSGVAEVVRLSLPGAWLTPSVAQHLKSQYGDRILFIGRDGSPCDAACIEKSKTGVHVTRHMATLGLDKEAMEHAYSDDEDEFDQPTPSSVPSSFGSALADLDTFSVTRYETSPEDAKNDDSTGDSAGGDSFFSEADLEEWATSGENGVQEEPSQPEDVDVDDDELDEELDDMSDDGFDTIMGNMDDMAHHIANEADITYLVNFAPELLQVGHNLDHLM